MASKFRSTLPKVISKANKDISTIIENDIAKESEILKNLVDQVIAANLEVKKKNNQRINDTRRKLQELDIEIEDLNKSIDLVDRETVIEQLNEMIDAENKIFKARQEIRFFENESTPSRLENLTNIYESLAGSVEATHSLEANYKDILADSNTTLFTKQNEITTEVIELMNNLYQEKRTYIKQELTALNDTKQRVFQTEKEFNLFIEENIKTTKNLDSQSSSFFTNEDNDEFLNEKITNDHNSKLESINNKIETITSKYETKKIDIIASFRKYENNVRQKLESKNKAELDKEKKAIDQKDEELKNIRLLIIDAEKKQNYSKVQSLMKKFEKVEKSKVSSVLDKTGKLFTTETKRQREKTIQQLSSVETKYVTDLNKQEFALKLADIEFEEAKILYKIKSDSNALQSDQQINKRKLQTILDLLTEKERVTKLLAELRLQHRIAELEIMKQNELRDNTLLEQFKALLTSLKESEHKRILSLQENIGNHELIQVEQNYNINKTILDLQLSKELSDVDKLILQKRNDSLIRIEKIKEDANSEIIYQESLIKIAKKEHELQLVKVQSLYENERSLAEEQVERIHLGVKVNDTFVKTTLENQLLFASQQIQCAKSEYEIRIESIALTKDQELAYANKKIDYYRQKYEYEKSKIRKELDDKLEDLNYKLLLFTDKKDNDEIQRQIDNLNNRFQIMIDEIEDKENIDEEIKRYEKVILAAEERALQAINEALALKEQTTTAFEALYEQTKLKYDQIERTNHSEDTQGIMPLLSNSAVSSADTRLQKATQEADELYQERILKPTQIINKTKETLLEEIKDEETEIFCQEQKQVKKDKIKAHSEKLDQIHLDRKNKLQEVSNMVTKTKNDIKANLQNDVLTTETSVYRDEETIEKEYQDLIQNEKFASQSYVKELSIYKQQRLLEHKQITKETTQWIKQTLKPYKKYIRQASRGLNAEKRELTRKNKRTLKKAISEMKSNFKPQI